MSLKQQLEDIAQTEYFDYEGNSFKIKLKTPLSNKAIAAIQEKIPQNNLTIEMKDLLSYSRGFEIPNTFLEPISFEDFDFCIFEQLLNFCLFFTHDGIGGFWIQEISNNGTWGNIYYLGHDPAVLIKQADDLPEFIEQLNEYILIGEDSFFSEVFEKKAIKIYEGKGLLLEIDEALSSKDDTLRTFALNYNKDWFIADMRNAKKGEGFRLEADYAYTIRCGEELIWALKKQKNFWSWLKEKFKR